LFVRKKQWSTNDTSCSIGRVNSFTSWEARVSIPCRIPFLIIKLTYSLCAQSSLCWRWKNRWKQDFSRDGHGPTWQEFRGPFPRVQTQIRPQNCAIDCYPNGKSCTAYKIYNWKLNINLTSIYDKMTFVLVLYCQMLNNLFNRFNVFKKFTKKE
jgi:hypothetical protein